MPRCPSGKGSTFADKFQHGANLFVDNGSLHGLSWYNFLQSPKLRNAVFIGGTILICIVPIFIGYQTSIFLNDKTVKTTLKWSTATRLDIPNIAICHPMYFNANKMKALNISASLANYMIHGINFDNTQFLRIRLTAAPSRSNTFNSTIHNLETELQDKMVETKLDFLNLIKALRIECNNFIAFCEFSDETIGQNKCCEMWFDPEPFFTPNAGICWNSNWNFVTYTALQSGAVKIWTNIKKREALGLDFNLHGAGAVERAAPKFVLPLKNLAGGILYRNPLKLPLGQVTSLSLTKTKVDRSALNSNWLTESKDLCISLDADFETKYGMPYTEINCEVSFTHHRKFHNCSVTPSLDIPNVFDMKACEPKDLVQKALKVEENAIASPPIDFQAPACQKECIVEDYDKFLSVGTGDFKVMLDHFKRIVPSSQDDANDFSGLEIYFSSMEYSETVLYRDGFDVFLSRIGGSLGLALGASILSLFELVVLFGYFFKSMLSSLARK